MIGTAPMYVNWNYTYKCNLNCKHCYSRGREHLEELSTDKYFKIVKQLSKANVFEITLGGGEPLLRKDCIAIIKEISIQGMKSNLSTNGWNLTKNNCKSLKEAQLGRLFVSLDHSNNEKHDYVRGTSGSWNSAILGIKNAVDAELDISISTVVTSVNFDDMDNIVRLAINLGVNRIDFKRFKTKGNGEKNKDTFVLSKEQELQLYNRILKLKNSYPKCIINLVYNENQYEDIDQGCPCGKQALALNPQGEILPCIYNDFSLGNILECNLNDLWRNNEVLIEMRNNLSCMGISK